MGYELGIVIIGIGIMFLLLMIMHSFKHALTDLAKPFYIVIILGIATGLIWVLRLAAENASANMLEIIDIIFWFAIFATATVMFLFIINLIVGTIELVRDNKIMKKKKW